MFSTLYDFCRDQGSIIGGLLALAAGYLVFRGTELKQELGLGDYEGRGWRGFHHHATLCIAAYGFLIAERGALPPSGPPFAAPLARSAIPGGYRRRGAADPTRAPHPKLDRDNATTPHRRSRQDPPEMPLLQHLSLPLHFFESRYADLIGNLASFLETIPEIGHGVHRRTTKAFFQKGFRCVAVSADVEILGVVGA
jgi:hypothetical protein